MPGVNMSFVAAPEVADRLQSAARADGVTPSRATSLAVTLGATLPPHARRLLRFILEEGDEVAARDLQERVTRAISVVGNAVLERQLLAQAAAQRAGLNDTTEDEAAAEAIALVSAVRRERAEAPTRSPDPSRTPSR